MCARVSWEPTPEDPTVEWTVPDATLGTLYAAVSGTVAIDTSGDYDVPHQQQTWHWAVSDARSGTDLATGEADTRDQARTDAEAALAAATRQRR